jgi:hypothetical protein
MKMKKLLLGAFLGIFTLAGIAFLPNYASAADETGTTPPVEDDEGADSDNP